MIMDNLSDIQQLREQLTVRTKYSNSLGNTQLFNALQTRIVSTHDVLLHHVTERGNDHNFAFNKYWVYQHPVTKAYVYINENANRRGITDSAQIWSKPNE